MTPIYSLKMMRSQVLNEIRHPGDATMQVFVDAWLNEQVQHYAEKWDFHSLLTRWSSLVSSTAQFDTTLPRLLRNVPRDMIKPVQAWLMDPNETPENWSEIKIIPMKEFDRKFAGPSFTENPNKPSHMALREMESMVFEPRTAGDATGFTEDCEALAVAPLATQNGWTVTSPAHAVLDVVAGSEMTGVNSIATNLVSDPINGRSHQRDVPPAEFYTLSWRQKIVTGTIRQVYVAMSDQNDLVYFATLNGTWGITMFQTPIGAINFFIGGGAAWWTTTLSVPALSAGDHTFLVSVDANKLFEFSIDGAIVFSRQLSGDTLASRIHFAANETTPGVVGTGVFDDIVYTEQIPPSEFPIGLDVTSTSGSEDADTTVGVNYYGSADRQRIVKGEITQPGTTAKVITANAVFGIIGFSKSDYTLGEIVLRTTSGELVARLMPHEISAQFWALAFFPYPDLDYEVHLIYKRRPPLMSNASDTFMLLPSPLGPAILQGAIVRGLKFLEDADWLAAEALQARLERDFVRFHLTDFIEDAYAYIG